MEITNQWPFEEFVNVSIDNKSAAKNGEEFIIHIRKKNKLDNMRFSSEYTQDILTLLYDFESKFAGQRVERKVSLLIVR